MNTPRKIVVFQTAFIGDVILALPLFQLLHEHFPAAWIAAVTIPAAAGVLANHPAVSKVLVFDKRGARRGVLGILRMSWQLRALKFDVALIPHRSLRSALVCRLAGIRMRVGFSSSAGKSLLTHRERYVFSDHEILRDLALVRPLGIAPNRVRLPRVYPGHNDREAVDRFLRDRWGEAVLKQLPPMIAVAPGSVWNTKRWPEPLFVVLVRLLLQGNWHVVLLGGDGDRVLCARIRARVPGSRVADASGRLTILQSAEMIRRCAALVSNDSAPMHLAGAVDVPVVAIFGATSPAFGFAPVGPVDRVVETTGLACRPCSIHGGKKCPIGTFDCMEFITPVRVMNEVVAVARRPSE